MIREEPLTVRRTRGLGKATVILREGLEDILAEQLSTVTVRQAYYLAVVRKLVGKTEAGYKKVQRNLVQMRRDGSISHEAIADGTRWMRKPKSYDGMDDMLRQQQRLYRRDLWQDQEAYVEVWCEKDALAGVVMEKTRPWDVPLMVSRGFSSESFLYSAAEQITAEGKPAYIYLLSDFDKAGFDLANAIESGLERLAPEADVTFERIALNAAQVQAWGIETRDPKEADLKGDWRAIFGHGCAELDAIPPQTLLDLVEGCITQHIDQDAYDRHLVVERAERASLSSFVSSWQRGGSTGWQS